MKYINKVLNIAISASAGTGKTYQLTDRFIKLLHYTEDPKRIIALTFTKNAANEFFSKIVSKLYFASQSDDESIALSKRLDIVSDSYRYKYLLKILISQLDSLNLQTLDSFFFKIVQCFGPEIGFKNDIKLISDTSKKSYEKQTRDTLIHSYYVDLKYKKIIKQFWYAFNQSNYGKSKVFVEKTISNYIDNLFDLYKESSNEELWGNENFILKDLKSLSNNKEFNWGLLASNIKKSIPNEFSKEEKRMFNNTANLIKDFYIHEKLNTILERCFENFKGISKGPISIKVGRGYTQIIDPLRESILKSLNIIIIYYLNRALKATKGTYIIIKYFDKEYEKQVRSEGKLSFNDIINILDPKTKNSIIDIDYNNYRSLIDYRLDAKYDHWLFDEFQDTNRQQWRAISNLVDEALQDNSGKKSVFFVGDAKQSLYLWRNSDDMLLEEISAKYKLTKKNISKSYRSSPNIIKFINLIFSDSKLLNEYYGTETSKRWMNSWEKHSYDKSLSKNLGYVAWIKSNQNNFNINILNILNELKPNMKNFSIGILARKNDEVLSIANFIRKQNLNIPIRVGSANCPAKDSLVGVILISMLKVCLHPEDKFHLNYLKLIKKSLVEKIDLIRKKFSHQKSAFLITNLAKIIIQELKINDSGNKRHLYSLINASINFDSDGNKSWDSLISYLENFNTKNENKETINIETIHRSKGLEYDVVILINNEKRSFQDNSIQAFRDKKKNIDIVMEPFKKEIMLALPKTNKMYQQIKDQNNFSNLCTLYVALTRAKKSIYMLSDTNKSSKNSLLNYIKDCLSISDLKQSLSNDKISSLIWENGDKNWFKNNQIG